MKAGGRGLQREPRRILRQKKIRIPGTAAAQPAAQENNRFANEGNRVSGARLPSCAALEHSVCDRVWLDASQVIAIGTSLPNRRDETIVSDIATRRSGFWIIHVPAPALRSWPATLVKIHSQLSSTTSGPPASDVSALISSYYGGTACAEVCCLNTVQPPLCSLPC